MKQYFTELEAAAAAGVSLETIKEFISLGVLKLNPSDSSSSENYLTRSDLLQAFHTLKLTADDDHDSWPVTDESKETPEPAPADNSVSSNQEEPTVESAYGDVEVQQEVIEETIAKAAEPIHTDTTHEAQFVTHSNPTVHKGDQVIEHRSFELLDLNKTLKEQLEMLKEERDWLRKRVETLETRSERDQLLLLSETKTVQKLLPEPRRSFWALPWFTR